MRACDTEVRRWGNRAKRDGGQQARQHFRFEAAEAAVKAEGSLSPLASRGLGLADAVKGAADGVPCVAESDVFPARTLGNSHLTTDARLQHRLGMIQIGSSMKADQAITEHFRIHLEPLFSPTEHGCIVDTSGAFDQCQAGKFELLFGRHRDQKGLFGRRAVPSISLGAPVSRIGIVDLGRSALVPRLFALGQALQDHALEPRCRAVAHGRVLYQFQRRKDSFTRRQHMQDQLLSGQRQHAHHQQRAVRDPGLLAAAAALSAHPTREPESGPRSVIAGGASKTLRPARPMQCPEAFFLRPVAPDDFRHRQIRLKPHPVHRRDRSPHQNRASTLRLADVSLCDNRPSFDANQDPKRSSFNRAQMCPLCMGLDMPKVMRLHITNFQREKKMTKVRIAIRECATELTLAQVEEVAGGQTDYQGRSGRANKDMQCDLPTDCWVDGGDFVHLDD